MSGSGPKLTLLAFDLGGVLFADGSKAVLDRFPDDQRETIRALLRSPRAKDLRRGTVSDEDFWNWAPSQLPDGVDPQALRLAWYDAYTLDQPMFDLVTRLATRHPDIPRVVFSGNIASRVEHLDHKFGFRRLFDFEHYSYEAGATKPQLEFVDSLLRRVEASPNQIAYIDDRQNALDAAAERGIEHGIRYESPDIAAVVARLEEWGFHAAP